jgi:N-acetylmuramoyl-L-alanine amidase
MPKFHEVQPGECLSSIAFIYGFYAPTLWDQPENQELRNQRGSMFQLVPGDRVYIPDVRLRSERISTGQRHRFRRRGVPEKLRIRLLDPEGKPRAGLPYALTVGDTMVRGETSEAGMIEHFIPPDAMAGELLLEGDAGPEVYKLSLGRLLPITSPRGVRQRLRNLGYLPPDGADGEGPEGAVEDALRRFQRDHGLPESGDADEATRGELDRFFGER